MEKLRNQLTCTYLNIKHNKKGQAIIEYSIVFVIAIMGTVVYLTLMQANFNAGIQRQMNQLVQSGEKFL